MEKVFFLLSIVYAVFRVHSPDSLSKLDFNVQVSMIGNPCLYPTYGKLLKSHNCQVNARLQYEDIVVATNVSEELVRECVENVERMGGRGVVIVQDKAKVIMNGYDDYEENGSGNIRAFVLGIEKKVFRKYLEEVSDVWVSYRYDLLQSSYPFVEFKFSGNFTRDLGLVRSFMRFNEKVHVLWESVTFLLVYDEIDSGLPEDCVVAPSGTMFCKKGDSGVTGKQILENYSIILSVYNHKKTNKSSESFLDFLVNVFLSCDYNAKCTLDYARSRHKDFKTNPEILDLYTVSEKSQGSITVNSVQIPWPSYLDTAFCLSFFDPPQYCQKCSQGCLFSDLQSKNCSIWCNNQNCGYSNLNCLEKSGCFSFMLNDGHCNSLCENDPDCEDDGLYIKFFVYSVLSCCIIIFVV